MAAGTRGRRIGALAASAAVHLLVLATLAFYTPRFIAPPETAEPPVPIIPVLLTPRTPPNEPSPVRLHRRRPPYAHLPIPPLIVPKGPVAEPARPGPAAPSHPAPLPEGPTGDLRTALRASPVGCANEDAVALTKEERAHCAQVFGKIIQKMPTLGLGVHNGGAFEAAGARKLEAKRWQETPYVHAAPPADASPGKGPSEPFTPPILPP